ncbi:IS66 family insertion sequence element accessory protein TnpA [Massilia sp. TWR1-2-2]|uniref:IS66 family insertion sequence element accessory protein TnpA n=1 Tax=Massilia sp. TWR1-2-2 TaxID=2804584 RepID=UPI003CE8DA45
MRNESTRQAWTVRLQEQANSGLGIRPWCVREGLTEASFHYWRKSLAQPSTATRLIALPMAAGHPEPMLELRTPHGNVIRLSHHEQVRWLGGVLEALR